MLFFFFQAKDGIRDLGGSRGLGDVYKRQIMQAAPCKAFRESDAQKRHRHFRDHHTRNDQQSPCLLYTSDAADERSSVDLGGRRIIKKKNDHHTTLGSNTTRINSTHSTTHNNRAKPTAKKTLD